LTTRQATDQERLEALEVLFQSQGVAAEVTRRRVRSLLGAESRGEVDLSGLFVAKEGPRTVGACMALPSPGRTVIVIPPRGAMGDGVSDQLMACCGSLAVQRGAVLLQSMTDPADEQTSGLLLRAGYEFLAQIAYLERAARRRGRTSAPSDELRWVTYGPDTAATFAQVIQRTYEASLDCPKLHGVRTIDDILEGHKAEGQFSPDRWFLCYRGPDPVGCLLLAVIPEFQSLDVVYMGLTPEARGQRLGRRLLIKALEEAEAMKAGKVTLAVDQENGPAMQLYRTLGFRVVMYRSVYGMAVQS
jgi:mycothiol synthase